jgi:hypothetical protein
MIGIRKLGIVLSATAIAATALAVGITAGTAHAQAAESVTITGVTVTQPDNQLSTELTVSLSVTCPAGDDAYLYASAQQVSIGTGEGSLVVCTGSAQAFTVSVNPVSATWNGPDTYGAGQVNAGATLVEDSSHYGEVWFPTVGTVGTFSTE